MSSKVKENIFWFEITINDSLLVKVGQRLHHLGGVNFGAIVTESLLFAKVGEQLTTVEEIHNEVQFGVCLKRKMEFDYVWVTALFQYLPLSHSFCQKIHLDKLALLENFHRIDHLSVLLSDEVDFAKGPTPNDFDVLKIINADLLIGVHEIINLSIISSFYAILSNTITKSSCNCLLTIICFY